jgi:hypothetical protein
VHVGPPTCMRWRGVGGELGHSFVSPGLRKRNEVVILYYDTEGHVRRQVVSWLPLIPFYDRASEYRMKSFRLGGGSLFDLVSALAPHVKNSHFFPPFRYTKGRNS